MCSEYEQYLPHPEEVHDHIIDEAQKIDQDLDNYICRSATCFCQFDIQQNKLLELFNDYVHDDDDKFDLQVFSIYTTAITVGALLVYVLPVIGGCCIYYSYL